MYEVSVCPTNKLTKRGRVFLVNRTGIQEIPYILRNSNFE